MKSYKLGNYSIDIESSSLFCNTRGWFNCLPVFSVSNPYWYEWKINTGFLWWDIIIYIINNREFNNHKYFK